jgi:hypothetical protein
LNGSYVLGTVLDLEDRVMKKKELSLSLYSIQSVLAPILLVLGKTKLLVGVTLVSICIQDLDFNCSFRIVKAMVWGSS